MDLYVPEYSKEVLLGRSNCSREGGIHSKDVVLRLVEVEHDVAGDITTLRATAKVLLQQLPWHIKFVWHVHYLLQLCSFDNWDRSPSNPMNPVCTIGLEL